MSDTPPLIVVRRARRKKHSYHGGAWKVAYADFVTAMMAFFLVMWLLGIGTREQKAAISEYFRNPSMTPGTATVAPPGKFGQGGASDSMIKLGGAMDISHGPGKDRHGATKATGTAASGSAKRDSKDIEKEARREEKARLESLMDQLHAAIEKSQALAPFKDQLLLDITPEGLRIQIVDKLNRPMFDQGSAHLKPYTVKILHELATFINRVPNRISIAGHTDDAPYSSDGHYSNWELSADRANAARRALVAGGLLASKMARIVGLAATVPLDKAHPGNPINRRISIIVMTKQAEDAALSRNLANAAVGAGGPTTVTSAPTKRHASSLTVSPPGSAPASGQGADIPAASRAPPSP
ncbi:MAG: motility protein MotB [Rhodanobacter sp.]|nr:MAG: motility protein MotB [Rhodanobacter sp.]